jgi:hypothetical protein
MLTYDCPEACDYSIAAWEPHCNYTGRDNYQGACGNIDFGGIKQMRYPCPTHRGLRNPALAPAIIGSDSQLGSAMWRNAPAEGSVSWSNGYIPQGRLRQRWEHDENLYERDLSMRGNLDDMSSVQWLVYYNDIHSRYADSEWGRRYEWDPQPWGDARAGGALLEPGERFHMGQSG